MQINFTLSSDTKADVSYYVGKSYSEILGSDAGIGIKVSSTSESVLVGADEEVVVIVRGKSPGDQVSIRYQLVEDIYVPGTIFGVSLVVVGIGTCTGIVIISVVGFASKHHINTSIDKYTQNKSDMVLNVTRSNKAHIKNLYKKRIEKEREKIKAEK